jgi:hypothetical protein
MGTINELKKWLKQPGNNEALLAGLMGYASAQTVTNWLKNGIPSHQQARVLEIIKKKWVKNETK